MTLRRTGFVVLATLGLAATGTSGASAQTAETRAAAVTLFDEGRALMAQGKYAEACPKLEESQQMDPGAGTLFNLSDCYERIGRLASAWTGFREVAMASAQARQPDREKVARQRTAALEGRLTRLKVVVSEEAAAQGVSVKRNDTVVSRPLWGTPVPVDPGEQRISAAAPGRKTWEARVVARTEGATVEVKVPALAVADATAAAPASPNSAAQPNSSTQAPSPGGVPPDTTAGSTSSIQAPLGLVIGGVGVVGMGIGTALAFAAKSKADSADCDANNHCSAQGTADRNSAVGLGNVATGVFIGGGVFAAAGLVLFLTAPSAEKTAVTAGPRVTWHGDRVTFSRSF